MSPLHWNVPGQFRLSQVNISAGLASGLGLQTVRDSFSISQRDQVNQRQSVL